MHRLDTLVAGDLGLTLAPATTLQKYIKEYPKLVDGLVFAYEQDGYVCYDRVPMWRVVNGMRVKRPRFKSHPAIEERLRKRLYKRWYIEGSGFISPVAITKVDDLKDQFYFLTDDTPHHHSEIIFTEETQFLRKKPLLFHRTEEKVWCAKGTTHEKRVA